MKRLLLVLTLSLSLGCASVDRFNALSADLTRDAITASEDHRCTVHAPPCLSDPQFKQTNVILNQISVAGVTFTKIRITGAALPSDTTAFLIAVSTGITDLARAFPNGEVGTVLTKLATLQQQALDLLPKD